MPYSDMMCFKLLITALEVVDVNFRSMWNEL